MLQDLAERDWILRPALSPGIEAIQEAGLTFDALVQADQLTAIGVLADRHPSLSIVLDHAGKPPFRMPPALASWRREIRSLANRPNVSCKHRIEMRLLGHHAAIFGGNARRLYHLA